MREETMDASWGDSIRRYRTEKLQAPEPVPQPKSRSYRDKRFGQKDREREFDILSQSFRNTQQEGVLQAEELAELNRLTKKAEEVCIAYESHYDVITHEPRTIAKKAILKAEREKVPKVQPPPSPREFRRKPEDRGTSRYDWPHMHHREYNVINNRYNHVNHDQQVKIDQEKALMEASQKFFERNHYNPINGAFFDSNKEEHFQQLRKKEILRHGQNQKARLPLGLQKTEGYTFNILAPNITYDYAERLEVENAEAQHRLDSLKLRTEAACKVKVEEKEAQDTQRVLNRVSHNRYTEACGRGYDILTNRSFRGRLGKPYHNAKTRPSTVPTQQQLEQLTIDPMGHQTKLERLRNRRRQDY